MNYRHSYHAGNFADVFKHVILVSLIQAMQRKDNPFCYLDTHAGAGIYNLSSTAAQKSKEYQSGIGLLFKQKNLVETLSNYLACIHKLNQSELRYYPGSPSIVREMLRPQDRMVLSELHPTEYQLLKKQFAYDKQTSIQLLDGYQSLKAFLPPKERRGLILIDPPYEKTHELEHIAALIPLTLRRFATGVYSIWYPIKDRPPIERFYQTLKKSITEPILIAELSIYPETSAQHLNGCGMLIINPPWQLSDQINAYLPQLWSILSPEKRGQYRVFTLT
jgi:23S rRNA (adenine2030-N6)-methyltransferase